MTDLFLHNRKLETIFSLLGKDENDITYSLGWVLSRSSGFVHQLLNSLFQEENLGLIEEIRLQDYADDGGFTDVEITGPKVHVIIEAKRGWNLPAMSQLERYAPRLHSIVDQRTAIVVMSECASEYAIPRLPGAVQGIPVFHRSWKEVVSTAEKSLRLSSRNEKQILVELLKYLRGIMKTQDQLSNLVYVVSVTRSSVSWSAIPPVDYILKKNRYFHPIGQRGYPKEPPNYLGFRYDGKLQSIHYVESYEVADDLRKVFPGEFLEEQVPHLVYELGPAIRPSKEVKTGKIFRSGAVWAALDLLLTCNTISEARDKTQKRLENR